MFQTMQDLDAFSAAIIVNIAFSFIPASFAVAIVKVLFLNNFLKYLLEVIIHANYQASSLLFSMVMGELGYSSSNL